MATDATAMTWTPEEAAEHLKLHVRTIQELCAEGTLPAVKVAGKWRVLVARLCDSWGVPIPGVAPEPSVAGEKVRGVIWAQIESR